MSMGKRHLPLLNIVLIAYFFTVSDTYMSKTYSIRHIFNECNCLLYHANLKIKI